MWTALGWYLGGVASLAVGLVLAELLTGSGFPEAPPPRPIDRLNPPDDVTDQEWMYAEADGHNNGRR